MTEILKSTQYDEYEAFASSYTDASFTQSIHWTKVKKNWGHEVVVSRDANGKIRGGMLILIRRLMPGFTFLYAPRGPVADICDKEVFSELLDGAKAVAKKYRAFELKIDPMVLETDEEKIKVLKDFGFRFKPNADEYDTVQRRYNYVLPDIQGKTPEELMASFKPKCRYNIRVAEKHGVECKAYGVEGVKDFTRLSVITGIRDQFPVRSEEYYAGMLEAFGPEHMRIYLCDYQGHKISGAMTCNWGGRTSYIFGASDNEFRNTMPNYIMQWTMMQWALETNCKVYDFMGIAAKLDENSPTYGVYRFKTGFSGAVVAYAGEFDYVFNPLAYFIFTSMLTARKILGNIKYKIKNWGKK